MVLIDFSQIALSNIFMQNLTDENMIRHMILNSLRMYNKKHRNEYGQMVICVDSSSWRKKYFPQYKANRKTGRDTSTLDWDEIFRIINQLVEDLRNNFPYKVVKVDGAEADDIIGALVMNTQEFGRHEPVMIISADKDFAQLQRYDNVKQWSPIQKKAVVEKNPRKFLFEHIIRGDKSDGVPNVLSPDNSLVENLRQSPITQKKIDTWLESFDSLDTVMDSETYRNYMRNKKMIDLHEMPAELQEQIINTYDSAKPAMKMKVLNYLIKHRCKQLIECIEEFYCD